MSHDITVSHEADFLSLLTRCFYLTAKSFLLGVFHITKLDVSWVFLAAQSGHLVLDCLDLLLRPPLKLIDRHELASSDRKKSSIIILTLSLLTVVGRRPVRPLFPVPWLERIVFNFLLSVRYDAHRGHLLRSKGTYSNEPIAIKVGGCAPLPMGLWRVMSKVICH